MISVCVVFCLVVSGVVADDQVVSSTSEVSLDALKATLFENLTIDSSVHTALANYANIADNGGSSLNEIINGLKQLTNALPAAQQNILRENLDKQRENMQSYLEETDNIVTRANNSDSNQCFLVVNSGLASYMTQSDSTNNYDGNQVCHCIVYLGNEYPSVATVALNRFSFNISNPNAQQLCQQQVFGLLVTAQGGSTSANSIIHNAESKISSLKNSINNAVNSIQTGVQNAANYANNAASNAGEALSHLASNVQNTVSG